jgi:hypothetical protein
MDQSGSAANNPLLAPPELSPLEQEVLEEYERLSDNMKKVSWMFPHCQFQPEPPYTSPSPPFYRDHH